MIVSNERERALRTKKVLRHIAEGDVVVEEQVMRRGEIYHADLNPVFGSEQGGYRPVLIIQNNRGNQHSPTVIVAAITSQPKTKLPTHVPINGIYPLILAIFPDSSPIPSINSAYLPVPIATTDMGSSTVVVRMPVDASKSSSRP